MIFLDQILTELSQLPSRSWHAAEAMKLPSFEKAMDWIGKDRIYLSLDMDVMDPAFAPGIGNPEPFGLNPLEIKRCVNYLGSRLVGFDVCEVSPPFDNGNTSALAARLVREVIMAVWKAQM